MQSRSGVAVAVEDHRQAAHIESRGARRVSGGAGSLSPYRQALTWCGQAWLQLARCCVAMRHANLARRVSSSAAKTGGLTENHFTWRAPGAPESLPKGGGLRSPRFARVSGLPGAARPQNERLSILEQTFHKFYSHPKCSHVSVPGHGLGLEGGSMVA